MTTRYFYRYSDGKISSLFKAEIDDDAETFNEFQWTPDGWVKQEYGTVFAFLLRGEGEMVEVSSKEAQTSIPNAFNDAGA